MWRMRKWWWSWLRRMEKKNLYQCVYRSRHVRPYEYMYAVLVCVYVYIPLDIRWQSNQWKRRVHFYFPHHKYRIQIMKFHSSFHDYKILHFLSMMLVPMAYSLSVWLSFQLFLLLSWLNPIRLHLRKIDIFALGFNMYSYVCTVLLVSK